MLIVSKKIFSLLTSRDKVRNEREEKRYCATTDDGRHRENHFELN